MLLSLQGTVPQRGVHVHRKLESVDYLKERGREGEGKRNRHKVGGGQDVGGVRGGVWFNIINAHYTKFSKI